MTYVRPILVDVYQRYAIIQIMFRLIILVAIFFAVYPMIGNGYDQFMTDFNFNGVGNFVSNMIDGLADFIDNLNS